MDFNLEPILGHRRNRVVSDANISAHVDSVDRGDVDCLTDFGVVFPFAPIDWLSVSALPYDCRRWITCGSALKSQVVFLLDDDRSSLLQA